ncbi:MAG TPA: S-adenosylmethionine synthetase N-terminal domain-containing protein, partial [Vicinamibacteria bacterium]
MKTSGPVAARDPAARAADARRTARGVVLTSESVAEGHPDKVCDYIADSILDAYLELDRRSRVACEVLCKSGIVVLAGEISSIATLDHVPLIR